MSKRRRKRKIRMARHRRRAIEWAARVQTYPAADQFVGLHVLERRLLLSAAPSTSEAMQLFNASPAVFVENQGQWADASIDYLFQGSGANIAFTDEGPMFQVFRRELVEEEPTEVDEANEPFDPLDDLLGEKQGYVTEVAQFSVRFDGANMVSPTGLHQSESRFNYMVGDPWQHRSNVPSYEVVAYENLYDGIDLHTFGRRDSLKYEFYVAPGCDYTQIEVSYDGIEGLSIDDSGALHVHLPDGPEKGWRDLVDDAPYIYQMVDGVEVEVAGSFELVDGNTYRFEITGAYDSDLELVIDPNLDWSTYVGGSDWDFGWGIATDDAGNVLITGQTSSTSWASGVYRGGDWDAFVVKLTADGGLVWSTYIGGSNNDFGSGIATDANGNVLVTGNTYSPDWAGGGFGGGGVDAFVVKLSSGGGLMWSTYLGGSNSDYGSGITTDANGNVLVTGDTYSPDWAGGGFGGGGVDAFVVKLSSGGGLMWSAYVGGSNSDQGRGLATDGAGNVLVTGFTISRGWASGDFGGGLYDAFVVKLSAGGGLMWSTYLGGSDSDYGCGIATDANGNVLITGQTRSPSWLGGGYGGGDWDAFVVKLSADGGLMWSAYVGGSNSDQGRGLATDGAGNVLVTGVTSSPSWAGGGFSGGVYDAFVVKLSSGGGLMWSTYLGGSNSDYGSGITTDANGNVLITGQTSSTRWAGGDIGAGDWDAFVVKISNRTANISGDFDADQDLDVDDLDLLTATGDLTVGVPAGSVGAVFDLNGDSTVDSNDLEKWLIDAAAFNGFASPYLKGDNDLDHDVDTGDLTIGITNFTGADGVGKVWSQGDYDGDGDVDTGDITNAIINFTGAGGGGRGGAAAGSTSLQGLTAFLDARSSGANLTGDDESGEDSLVTDRVLAV